MGCPPPEYWLAKPPFGVKPHCAECGILNHMGIPKNPVSLGSWITGILFSALMVYWWFDSIEGTVFSTIPVKLLGALLTCVVGAYLMLINHGD